MLAALITIPLLSRDFLRSAPHHFRLAADLLMNRPAPWAVVPKLNSMALGVPTRTQLLVPILPGIRTGWPTSLYSAGTSGLPGGKDRVAPLRWTMTFRIFPSTLWVSSLATLWAT